MRSDQPTRAAFVVAGHFAPARDPANFPVRAKNAEFFAEGPAGFEQTAVNGVDARSVAGMHEREETLVGRLAGDDGAGDPEDLFEICAPDRAPGDKIPIDRCDIRGRLRPSQAGIRSPIARSPQRLAVRSARAGGARSPTEPRRKSGRRQSPGSPSLVPAAKASPRSGRLRGRSWRATGEQPGARCAGRGMRRPRSRALERARPACFWPDWWTLRPRVVSTPGPAIQSFQDSSVGAASIAARHRRSVLRSSLASSASSATRRVRARLTRLLIVPTLQPQIAAASS